MADGAPDIMRHGELLRTYLRTLEALCLFKAGGGAPPLPEPVWRGKGVLAAAMMNGLDPGGLVSAVSFAMPVAEQDRLTARVHEKSLTDDVGAVDDLENDTGAVVAWLNNGLEAMASADPTADRTKLLRVAQGFQRARAAAAEGDTAGCNVSDSDLARCVEHLLLIRGAGGRAWDIELLVELALIDASGGLVRDLLIAGDRSGKKAGGHVGKAAFVQWQKRLQSILRQLPHVVLEGPEREGGTGNFAARLVNPAYEDMLEGRVAGEVVPCEALRHRGEQWYRREKNSPHALSREALRAAGCEVHAFKFEDAAGTPGFAVCTPALFEPGPNGELHPGMRLNATSDATASLNAAVAWMRGLPQIIAADHPSQPGWLRWLQGLLREYAAVAHKWRSPVHARVRAAMRVGALALRFEALRTLPLGRDDGGGVDAVLRAAAPAELPLFDKWRVPRDSVLRGHLVRLAAGCIVLEEGRGYAIVDFWKALRGVSGIGRLLRQLCRWPREVQLGALTESDIDTCVRPYEVRAVDAFTHVVGGTTSEPMRYFDFGRDVDGAQHVYRALPHLGSHTWQEFVPDIVPLAFTLTLPDDSGPSCALGSVTVGAAAVGDLQQKHAHLRDMPLFLVLQRFVAAWLESSARSKPLLPKAWVADVVITPAAMSAYGSQAAYDLTFPHIPVERARGTAVCDALRARLAVWLNNLTQFRIARHPVRRQHGFLKQVLSPRFPSDRASVVMPFVNLQWACDSTTTWRHSSSWNTDQKSIPLTDVDLVVYTSARRFAVFGVPQPQHAWCPTEELVYPCEAQQAAAANDAPNELVDPSATCAGPPA